MSLNFEIFKNKLSESHKLNIKYKDTSLFMKIFSYLLFFNKDFMTNYVTTIGSTVYFPSKHFVDNNQAESIQTLAHEFIHVNDNKKYSIFYKPAYLFPQCLALLSLLTFFAFMTSYAFLFLLFLIFLLPIPSYTRTHLELRGYQMTLYIRYLYLKHLNIDEDSIKLNLNKNIEIISERYFKGSAYYFMWPKGVKEELSDFAHKIMSGNVPGRNNIYLIITDAFNLCKLKSKIP